MTCYRLHVTARRAWVRGDMLQITDHTLLPEGRMDGVIVAVAHDEFRGLGCGGGGVVSGEDF